MTPEANKALISLADSAERMANFCDILQAGIVAAKKTLDDIAVRVERAFNDPNFATKMGYQFSQAFKVGMMGFPPESGEWPQ